MDNEKDVVVESKNNEVEGGNESQGENITISKSDYEKLNQTLGSLKRENKDLKKPKESQETTEKTKPSDNSLLEKAFLRSAQITDAEEVELALSTAKKWGVSVDTLVDDPDFQVKLDKHRTTKSNDLATSKIKGTGAKAEAKNTLEYWTAKGQPPTPTDIPDRATRQKIVVAMMKAGKTGGKVFYND